MYFVSQMWMSKCPWMPINMPRMIKSVSSLPKNDLLLFFFCGELDITVGSISRRKDAYAVAIGELFTKESESVFLLPCAAVRNLTRSEP